MKINPTYIFAAVFLGIVLTVYFLLAKGKKDDEFKLYMEAIDSGVGESGDDISALLLRIMPSATDMTSQARTIYENTNYFLAMDDMDEILPVLRTSRQNVAAINRDFINLYGFPLNSFLQNKLSESDFKRVVAVIKNQG